MVLKPLALAAAAMFVLSGVSLAATTTKPAQTTTAAATTTKPAKPAGFFSPAELKAAVALSTMKDAKDKFATAKIDDTKGNVVGSVKEVVMGKTGMPTMVHVDVGDHVVSMSAKSVSYVQDKDVLMTKMSKAQIGKLKALKEKS